MRRHDPTFALRALLAILLAACSPGWPARYAHARGRVMIPVVADARSQILRASHILVVTIRSADVGPWMPHQPTGEQRRVALGLSLDEVVKGAVAQPPGAALRIDITQLRVGVGWRPPPGLWSSVALDVGAQLVAFSRTASDDAAVILNEPAGERIMRAAQALADVHLVAQTADLELRAVTATARPRAATLGFLFAEYLWARYGPSAMARRDDFELLAAVLEEPALDRIARTTLLTAMLTSVDAAEAGPQTDRLVIALFRLLALSEAKDLHDNLVETYLPNLIGLTGTPTRLAVQVFHDRAADRTAARAALLGYRGHASPAVLLAWLNAT